MLIVVLSPPSKFPFWAIPGIRTVAQAALGEIDYFHVSTHEQLRKEWAEKKSQNAIIFAELPDAELSATLCRGAAPSILIWEDPAGVAAHLSAYVENSLAGVRAASAAFATIHDIALKAQNKLILTDTERQSASRFLTRVVNFLGFEFAAEKYDEILAEIEGHRRSSLDLRLAASDDSAAQSSGVFSTFADVIDPYLSLLKSEPSDNFVWPRAAFSGTNSLGEPTFCAPDERVQLMGPARFLFVGPQFCLPAGDWEATAVINVSDNLSGNCLNSDLVTSGKVVAKAVSTLPAKGCFSLSLPFNVKEPRDPIEFRVWLAEGAIEGTFSLMHVSVGRFGT